MLLGREVEVQWLAGQLHDGRSVAVHGELGIGKSAVIRAEAAADGRRALIGGGLASLAWSSYLPLVRAIRVPLPAGDRAVVAAYVAHRVRGDLLVLDDLQLADLDTLSVLPEIAQRVRLMLAFRDGEPGSERAAAAARACGCELLRLGPLAEEDAVALVRARRSTLPELEARKLAISAGGNPLLCEELAREEASGGDGSAVVERRLARISEGAREALAILGLLGRGGPEMLLGEAAAELLDAGLLERQGPLLALRHPVFGERALSAIDQRARRRLHARLGASLADPGERARHLAAAGDLEAAGAAALQAARAAHHAVQRGRNLALAAECTTGAESDRLRLAAADLLAGAGEHALVERLLSRFSHLGGPQAAEVSLRRGRALLALGASGDAHQRILEGLAHAAEPGPLRLALQVERLRAELAGGRSPAALLEEATELAALCELASVAEAPCGADAGLGPAGGWRRRMARDAATRDLARADGGRA